MTARHWGTGASDRKRGTSHICHGTEWLVGVQEGELITQMGSGRGRSAAAPSEEGGQRLLPPLVPLLPSELALLVTGVSSPTGTPALLPAASAEDLARPRALALLSQQPHRLLREYCPPAFLISLCVCPCFPSPACSTPSRNERCTRGERAQCSFGPEPAFTGCAIPATHQAPALLGRGEYS